MFFKKAIYKQIDLYREGKSNEIGSIFYEFARFCKKDDLESVNFNDIRSYLLSKRKETTDYEFSVICIEFRHFLRYFRHIYGHFHSKMADENYLFEPTYDIIMRMKVHLRKFPQGRKPDLAAIRRVKSLKDESGLSLRAISRALGRDLKTVYKQYHYPIEHYKKMGFVKELSTE